MDIDAIRAKQSGCDCSWQRAAVLDQWCAERAGIGHVLGDKAVEQKVVNVQTQGNELIIGGEIARPQSAQALAGIADLAGMLVARLIGAPIGVSVKRPASRSDDTLNQRVGMLGRMAALRCIDAGRHPLVDLVYRGQQFGNVAIFGLVGRPAKVPDDLPVGIHHAAGGRDLVERKIALLRPAAKQAAIGNYGALCGVILMVMGIHEARHDDEPAAFDNLGVRDIDIGTDRKDFLAFDQHIALP